MTTNSKYTEEEVIEEIQRLAEELDRVPRQIDMTLRGNMSTEPVKTHFYSWNNALEEAGLGVNRVAEYDIPELKDELLNVYEQVGRPLLPVDMEKHGMCTRSPYYKWFGSWARALREVGLPVPESHKWDRWGDDEWFQKRKKVLARDDNECVVCSMSLQQHEEKFGCELHIHHIKPFREFDTAEQADRMNNLVTLCSNCHRKHEGLPITKQREIFEMED